MRTVATSLNIVLLSLFVCSYSTNADAQEFDMKTELARLAKLDTFPANYGFYNSQGLGMYRKLLKTEVLEVRRQEYYYNMSWQYIYAGYPDSALICMENIPDMVWANAYKNNKAYDKLFMSGLAHLRIGEQKNCQTLHNQYSSLCP